MSRYFITASRIKPARRYNRLKATNPQTASATSASAAKLSAVCKQTGTKLQDTNLLRWQGAEKCCLSPEIRSANHD